MADSYLPEIMGVIRKDKPLFNVTEEPSEQITVKIHLNSVSLVLKDLNRKLSSDDMNASQDATNKNTIIVRGTPPTKGYGAQDILRVVQTFDTGANII